MCVLTMCTADDVVAMQDVAAWCKYECVLTVDSEGAKVCLNGEAADAMDVCMQ